MLTITVPDREYFDETKGEFGEFMTVKGGTLQLEHSLLSISKWESIWHVPYLTDKEHSVEQIMSYIKCMTVTNNVNPDIYLNLSNDNIKQISEYINDPMTATWFADDKKNSTSKEVITSELIYYWMIALQIPVEFQKWHLNRLLTLVKVCQAKNEPPKKMSRKDQIAQQRALNAQRRAALHSKG